MMALSQKSEWCVLNTKCFDLKPLLFSVIYCKIPFLHMVFFFLFALVYHTEGQAIIIAIEIPEIFKIRGECINELFIDLWKDSTLLFPFGTFKEHFGVQNC